MVTISSEAENTFVSLSMGQNSPWIGLYQNENSSSYAEPNGGWEWVTGECLDYENWSTGEPNNASTPPNGESYSHMTSFGTWNDWENDATATFIMEINCQDPIEICAVPGCMDSWACNYDSDATIDNGECEYLNDPIVSMTDYEWVLEYENGCYGEPTEISGSFILTFLIIIHGQIKMV